MFACDRGELVDHLRLARDDGVLRHVEDRQVMGLHDRPRVDRAELGEDHRDDLGGEKRVDQSGHARPDETESLTVLALNIIVLYALTARWSESQAEITSAR